MFGQTGSQATEALRQPAYSLANFRRLMDQYKFGGHYLHEMQYERIEFDQIQCDSM